MLSIVVIVIIVVVTEHVVLLHANVAGSARQHLAPQVEIESRIFKRFSIF